MKYIIHKKTYLDACKKSDNLKAWTKYSQNAQDKSYFNIEVVYVEPIKVTQLAQLQLALKKLAEKHVSPFIKKDD